MLKDGFIDLELALGRSGGGILLMLVADVEDPTEGGRLLPSRSALDAECLDNGESFDTLLVMFDDCVRACERVLVARSLCWAGAGLRTDWDLPIPDGGGIEDFLALSECSAVAAPPSSDLLTGMSILACARRGGPATPLRRVTSCVASVAGG